MTNAQTSFLDEIIVDNFAGGGGASTGIELATGRPVTIAVNHDPDAICMHMANHPYTEHYQASVWDIDPQTVCRGRPVGLAWFSPDCKHFSKAKGGNGCKQMLDDASDAKTDTDTDTDTKADAKYIAPPAPPARAGEPENGPDGGGEPDQTNDPELGRVMTYFLDKLNPIPPALAVEGLKNYTASLGADVVIHAMEICLGEKKTSWNYLRRILMRYESEGLRSMEAVRFSEQEHDARRSRKPVQHSSREPDSGDGFGLVDMGPVQPAVEGLVAGYERGWSQ